MTPSSVRLVLGAVLAAALAGCSSPTPQPSATAAAPSASTAAPATGGSTGAASSLAVYYAADEKGAPRLVREFHKLTTVDDSPAARVRAAVGEMLGTTALDPDYRTLWPSGARVLDVAVAGDTTTVDLTGVAQNNVGAAGEAQAIQQLVWTATAASGQPLVQIMRDGQTVESLWGHVDTRDPIKRAPAADTLYLVWVINPQQGDQTGRDVSLHLAGIVFEATLNYEILRDGKVVKHAVVMLDAGPPAQGQVTVSVRLDPGSYVVQAYEVSMKDGSRQHVDNHAFTVS